MEELKFCSPNGIPNKEAYLSKELKKTKGRRICSIKKEDNGDIKIIVENIKEKKGQKYFVKVIKKEDENYNDIIKYIDQNETVMKQSILIKYIEYNSFFVVFFRKIGT